MKEIKKVDAKSLAKMLGILYFVFGFVAGVFLFVVFVLIGTDAQEFSQVEAFVFGFGAPIALPVVYGVLGYVFGFVVAWIYNAIAQSFGGIMVELDDVTTP